jgi:hypothetical protein
MRFGSTDSVVERGTSSLSPEHNSAKRRRTETSEVPYRGLADDGAAAPYICT